MIKEPTREQCKDTGIILGVFFLYFSIKNASNTLFLITFLILVSVVVFPKIYKYLAVIWFGFSHLLGTVMTKILLTIIFYIVVAPVSIIRKLLNKDGMNLKGFKSSARTVWVNRDKQITRKDLFKPF
ncbi:MAG: hypothetical protein JXR69_04495 [Candidatus Delongbacteria bacterium]|nr:hypothetical protein [Candidatus Delongbacteria bacterium]